MNEREKFAMIHIIYFFPNRPDLGDTRVEKLALEFREKASAYFRKLPMGNESATGLTENEIESMRGSAVICSGESAPLVFRLQAENPVLKCIIAENPEFRPEMRNLFHRIETPVLILSSADLPWEIRRQAISYHDLIAGSYMVNVRSSSKYPVQDLNTQSFNSIVHFLKECT